MHKGPSAKQDSKKVKSAPSWVHEGLKWHNTNLKHNKVHITSQLNLQHLIVPLPTLEKPLGRIPSERRSRLNPKKH